MAAPNQKPEPSLRRGRSKGDDDDADGDKQPTSAKTAKTTVLADETEDDIESDNDGWFDPEAFLASHPEGGAHQKGRKAAKTWNQLINDNPKYLKNTAELCVDDDTTLHECPNGGEAFVNTAGVIRSIVKGDLGVVSNLYFDAIKRKEEEEAEKSNKAETAWTPPTSTKRKRAATPRAATPKAVTQRPPLFSSQLLANPFPSKAKPRGRPKGSPNKPKAAQAAPQANPREDVGKDAKIDQVLTLLGNFNSRLNELESTKESRKPETTPTVTVSAAKNIAASFEKQGSSPRKLTFADQTSGDTTPKEPSQVQCTLDALAKLEPEFDEEKRFAIKFVARITNENDSLKAEVTAATKQVYAGKKETTQIKERLANEKDQHKSTRSELHATKARLTRQLDTAEGTAKTTRKKNTTLEQDVKRLRLDREETDGKLADLKSSNSNIRISNARLEQEGREKDQLVANLERQLRNQRQHQNQPRAQRNPFSPSQPPPGINRGRGRGRGRGRQRPNVQPGRLAAPQERHFQAEYLNRGEREEREQTNEGAINEAHYPHLFSAPPQNQYAFDETGEYTYY